MRRILPSYTPRIGSLTIDSSAAGGRRGPSIVSQAGGFAKRVASRTDEIAESGIQVPEVIRRPADCTEVQPQCGSAPEGDSSVDGAPNGRSGGSRRDRRPRRSLRVSLRGAGDGRPGRVDGRPETEDKKQIPARQLRNLGGAPPCVNQCSMSAFR